MEGVRGERSGKGKEKRSGEGKEKRRNAVVISALALAYSSILQYTPVYSSISQYTPVYPSILQHTPVYYSNYSL